VSKYYKLQNAQGTKPVAQEIAAQPKPKYPEDHNGQGDIPCEHHPPTQIITHGS
jgi:hypothetical protein